MEKFLLFCAYTVKTYIFPFYWCLNFLPVVREDIVCFVGHFLAFGVLPRDKGRQSDTPGLGDVTQDHVRQPAVRFRIPMDAIRYSIS